MEGRTDNELKNYWNTWTRRCQRTKEPIYPPHVHPTKSSTEDSLNVIQPRYENTVRADGQDDIPRVFFDNSDFSKYLPYVSSFPQLPSRSSSICSGLLPSQSCTGLATGEGSHYNTVADPGRCFHFNADSNGGQLIIPDGVNFSAPQPVNNSGPEMCELPSFQNPCCRSDPVCAPASASVEQGGFLPSPNDDQMASMPHHIPAESFTINLDAVDWDAFLASSSSDLVNSVLSNTSQQMIPDGVNFSAPQSSNNGPEMCELPSVQNPCSGSEPVCAPASASAEQGGFLPPLGNDLIDKFAEAEAYLSTP